MNGGWVGEKTSTVKACLTTLSCLVAIAPMAKRNDIVRGLYSAAPSGPHRSSGLEPTVPRTTGCGATAVASTARGTARRAEQGDNLVREARRRHKEDRHDPAYRAQLERALRGADAAASQR
eukprot:scaffold1144_cov37-Phaeocystis_antarctica.AAC.2